MQVVHSPPPAKRRGGVGGGLNTRISRADAPPHPNPPHHAAHGGRERTTVAASVAVDPLRLGRYGGGSENDARRAKRRSRRKMNRPAPMMIAAPITMKTSGTSPNTR